MREAAPDTAFGSWSVTGIPLTIEYSLPLLQQIRAAAEEGRRQLSGGVEVGGLLFGDRVAKSIRILVWRPIACEYSRGAAFILSPNDRGGLAKQLRDAANDPELTGLYPLGWFVSHTNGGIELTAPDRKIFQQFFPANCQTTLVLHPGNDGSVRAGFFLRDSMGAIPSVSAREFTIEPDAQPQPAFDGLERPPERVPEPLAEPRPVAERAEPRRGPARRTLRDYRGWIWMVPALLALIVAGTMIQRTGSLKPSPSFSLRANEVGGDLRLEWDRNADVIRDAARGTLDIKDGNAVVPISLDAERLHDGYFNYTRKSGDLELRMTVYPSKGTPVTELAKYVGPPVSRKVAADNSVELVQERNRLQAELVQLREGTRKDRARIRQLEETVRILEQRVQVQKLLAPKQ